MIIELINKLTDFQSQVASLDIVWVECPFGKSSRCSVLDTIHLANNIGDSITGLDINTSLLHAQCYLDVRLALGVRIILWCFRQLLFYGRNRSLDAALYITKATSVCKVTLLITNFSKPYSSLRTRSPTTLSLAWMSSTTWSRSLLERIDSKTSLELQAALERAAWSYKTSYSFSPTYEDAS